MKKYPEIDYAQRPKSYWKEGNALVAVLRDVKGTHRRKLIKKSWRMGRLDALPEDLITGTLSDEARDSLGRIHPALMGGEYLPDYRPGETEIARLELRSTTADVISIRARPENALIRYRIVDEYSTEFVQQRQSSRRPLTLGGLVRFIDNSGHPDLPGGLALCYNEINADGGSDRESLRHFTTICSQFYPQLGQHYELVFADWVEEST